MKFHVQPLFDHHEPSRDHRAVPRRQPLCSVQGCLPIGRVAEGTTGCMVDGPVWLCGGRLQVKRTAARDSWVVYDKGKCDHGFIRSA